MKILNHKIKISQEQFITILGEEERKFCKHHALNESIQEDLIISISLETVEIKEKIQDLLTITDIQNKIYQFIENIYQENKIIYDEMSKDNE